MAGSRLTGGWLEAGWRWLVDGWLAGWMLAAGWRLANGWLASGWQLARGWLALDGRRLVGWLDADWLAGELEECITIFFSHFSRHLYHAILDNFIQFTCE